MRLLDILLGRDKPVRPDLDRLFALPSAALTLEAATTFRPTGEGSVCFASVEGGAFDSVRDDVRGLLGDVRIQVDRYGYTWLLARRPADDVAALVTDLHAVNSALEEAGFGPQLLCSLVAFRDDGGRPLALVYLYKRGSYYPFSPVPGERERRDNPLELEVAAALRDDLPVEADLSRWFPVWGAPGL